jgi:uncharacterized protein (DUF849 family)
MFFVGAIQCDRPAFRADTQVCPYGTYQVIASKARDHCTRFDLVSDRDRSPAASLAIIAMAMGGHARAGPEDNIYFSNGVPAKNNAELVKWVVKTAKEDERNIGTPTEARKILSLW